MHVQIRHTHFDRFSVTGGNRRSFGHPTLLGVIAGAKRMGCIPRRPTARGWSENDGGGGASTLSVR